MDLGQGYAQAGQGIAQGIGGLADAMQEYHKRHVAYDEQMKLFQSLSNIGYTPDGRLVNISTADEGGQKAKPVIDPKLMEMFTAKTDKERSINLGGLQMANRLGLSLIQHQAAEQIQHARDIPTDIGGVTVPLTPGQYASRDLEEQRIGIAKQPRGMTEFQKTKVAAAQAKQVQAEQEKLPEFQFQKKYQVLPKDILNQPVGYETVFSNPNETDPAKKKASGYIPTTPVYRERKFTENKDGVKQEGYAPDPEGEIINFKGQRIPFQEYTTLQNRAKFVYDRAKAALQRGTPPEEIAKRLEAMGFDPAGVQ